MIDEAPLETAVALSAVAITDPQTQMKGPRRHPEKDLATLAWAIHDLRLRRNSVFPSRLFGVGKRGWDMLFAMYAADLRGKRETVSSVSAAAFVTSTTGIRWLMALEADGWIARRTDVHDKRRKIVSLTPKARSAMRTFLLQVEHGSIPMQLDSK
jgi:Winged helix DNA-binding domain